MNDLQYDQISIDKLNLSGRSYNALKRAGINTLEELLDVYEKGKLLDIRNLGMKSYEEIIEAISEITSGNFQLEEDADEEEIPEVYTIPEEIEDIPVYKLKLSARLYHGLARGGINTVGKVLRMTNDDMLAIHGMGAKSVDELRNIIKEIKEEGIDYFDEEKVKNVPIEDKHKRTIDIKTVNKLREEYGFKTVWLTEWYNVTRSRIHQILNKRHNYGDWLNHELTDGNIALLLKIVEKRRGYFETDGETKAYFLSNRKDDCAVLFVNEEEIKCFFMSMLPEDIQQKIKDSRLECLSIEELEMASAGKTISILKEGYFCPDNPVKLRQFANIRRMSIDDYCVFLTGKKYAATQLSISDEKILPFLNAHYVNGQLMIPSNSSTQWFRSFISRNGYTIDQIAELYGFGGTQKSENEMQMFEIIEDDMQQYDISISVSKLHIWKVP